MSRSGIRSIGMTLARAALAAATVVTLALPASAKGPLSATFSGPGIHPPVELVDRTAAPGLVRRLMEQSGLWYARGDLPTPLEERPSDLGAAYTLTWISAGAPGESLEQRTIRQIIYPAADEGPVIHTPLQPGLQGWGPEVIGWFAAPAGFLDTLTELGAPITQASGLAPPSPGAAEAASQEPNSADGLVYVGILAVAVVGLVIAVRGRRLNPRLGERRVNAGQRQPS